MRIASIEAVAAFLPTLAVAPVVTATVSVAQEATPSTSYTCETAASASPMAGNAGTAMGTPAAEHDMAGMGAEFDQTYIDMMIPHHASIIALAQAAQDRLTDERLQQIADSIIASQQAEIAELRGLREAWYGSEELLPMDMGLMDLMAEKMPSMGDMEQMATLMDPTALVAAFCAAEDPDLAFTALTIPHHEMAIQASEAARERATHDEIRELSERVIADQQCEIDELTAIRRELAGESTPAA
jgi:uncharacterized protein (DUF305 family)